MAVEFQNNHYREVSEGIKNGFKYLRNGLKFKYDVVTPEKFNLKYSPGGCEWFGRKVKALPAAALCGVVKVTCHLALAIFVGIPKAIFDHGTYFKARIFSVARDFQESYGWLATLFNDRYGQFHVEESQFQKTCYLFSITKGAIQYDHLSGSKDENLSLCEYKKMSAPERKELVYKYNLNSIFYQLSNNTLDEFVDRTDDELLEFLTLK